MSRTGVTEWKAAELKEALAVAVTARMEDAAKLVEVDARSRLLRIRDPEFGLGYRKVLALYRLKSVVRRVGNVIEGMIGIPPGAKGGDYGYYIETGSRTAPAHPWLRPALLTNLKTIMQLLGGR